MENPYLTKDKNKANGSKVPVMPLMRIPTYEFKDNLQMENDLMRFELCVALKPNPRTKGFEKDAAIVYKDGEGNVYSVGLMQHNGVLKDTVENQETLKNIQAQSVRGHDWGEDA